MVKDMTSGNIAKHLVLYSIPLILGNLFQLTYNAVDSIIVGRCAGESALAAVGAASPVMNIVILGINGLCIGASVLMSEFFGGNKESDFRREFSTTLLFGTIFSLTVMVLGLLLSGPIMKLLSVPEEILDICTLYLRIVFCGMPFTCFYNTYASGMRSVGDSKTPVNFLAFGAQWYFGFPVYWDIPLGRCRCGNRNGDRTGGFRDPVCQLCLQKAPAAGAQTG